MQRRDFLATAAAAAAAQTLTAQTPAPTRKGRLKQGTMAVNFDPKLSFEDRCKEMARIGFKGMDMAGANDWPTLKKYGLMCTMGGTGGVGFPDGLIRKNLHDALVKSVSDNIDQCAANGVPNMISVGGQRKGMSDEEGIDNIVTFFNRVKAKAEDRGVTICLEVMNNRFDDAALGRTDQICNHVAFAAEIMKRVNSPRVKMLFDIYHVQIMDGDIVRNIRDNFQYIGHFHTGGVPGRHELDETQEINYRFVAQAIADLGFTGYISHEFRPTPGRDPIKSLEQAFAVMDV